MSTRLSLSCARHFHKPHTVGSPEHADRPAVGGDVAAAVPVGSLSRAASDKLLDSAPDKLP